MRKTDMRLPLVLIFSLLQLFITHSNSRPLNTRKFTRRDVPLIHPSQWNPEESTMDFPPLRVVNIKDVMIRNERQVAEKKKPEKRWGRV